MASLSPNQTSSPPYGSLEPRDQDRNGSLSSQHVGFLKSLTDKRTRDGQQQKRRGPKPDTKPALTRRQELNRQAQRTHRERKELYIKALEDEVLRLKDVFSTVSQDKERLADENRQLRALLDQNGMSTDSSARGDGGGSRGGSSRAGGGPSSSVQDDTVSSSTGGRYTSNVSMSISYVAPPSNSTSRAFTPPSVAAAKSQSGASGPSPGPSPGLSPGPSPGPIPSQPPGHHGRSYSPSRRLPPIIGGALGPIHRRNPNVDYDQTGIDFVLTLERPCMGHMPWLLERRTEASGHVLMASCPPEPFADLNRNNISFEQEGAAAPAGAGNPGFGEEIPQRVGQGGIPSSAPADLPTTTPYPHPHTWGLNKADLTTLLDLSMRLDLDGEITPVMAWGMILGHPRLEELGVAEFARLQADLVGKVRCYGFGAVLEEFELRDAINAVLSH